MVKFITAPWSLLIESFRKFNLRIVQAAVLDFLFYTGLLVVYLLSTIIINFVLNQPIEPGKSLTPVVIMFIAALVIVYCLFFLNIVFFKNLIWNRTANKKIKFKDFLKFSLATTAPAFAVLLVLRFGLSENAQYIVIPIYAFFYIYFIGIARTLFDGKIKQAIVKTFEIGVFKVYYFIIPLILMIVALWVLAFATSFIATINDYFYLAAAGILFLLCFAWARYYFTFIVNSLEHKKKR